MSVYQFSPDTGHYSQMVWASTSRLGCGLTEYMSGRFLARLMVCNYGEAGNLITAPVYSSGPACSACPPGTSCSQQYEGLCTGNGTKDSVSLPLLPQPLPSPVQPILPVLPQPVPDPVQPAQRPVVMIAPATPTCEGNNSFFCLLTQPGRAVETVMSSAHHMTHMMMDSVATLPTMIRDTVPRLTDFPNFFFSNLLGK